MEDSLKQRLRDCFESYPRVGLAYIFGSRANNGKVGPLSDYDFACYFDEADELKRSHLKLDLMGDLMNLLNTDVVDVVALNDEVSTELKYDVIYDGELIYEREPFKVLVDPRILNEYFDFRQSLRFYDLTKA